MDTRKKNVTWDVTTGQTGKCTDWQQVQTAVLMDIRDELQQLNRVFACSNFQRMPQILDRIKEATTQTNKRLAVKHPLSKGRPKRL